MLEPSLPRTKLLPPATSLPKQSNPGRSLGLRGHYRELRRAKLPFLLLWVAGATVVACFAGGTFLGFQIAGLAWAATLVIALFVLLRRPGSIRYPWWVWLPWTALVLIYLSTSHYASALQRSVMLLCPIVVGMAVSSYQVSSAKFIGLKLLMRLVTMALWVMVLVNTGLAVTGRLPGATNLAAQAITACLLAVYFAAEFANGNRQALKWWAGLAVVPVIALTRTAIVACAVTLPGTLGRLRLRKRVLMVALILAGMLAVFYTPRVQEKMFYSGHGSVRDLSMDNPDLQTSGRKALWEAMEQQIRYKPWFGYGANASEDFVANVTGGLTHPHNDWLRLRYDYGYVGTGIFIFSLLAQVLHLLRSARRATGDVRLLLYASVSSFLPFVLIMFTDNIILYCAFFGNLQFALMGMAYSALKKAGTR